MNNTPLTLRDSWRRQLSAVNWRDWLPSRGNILFTLLIAFLLIGTSRVWAAPQSAPAQAGTSSGVIAYQGRLADASGAALNGTYTVVFRLYNVASGGSPLWEEYWTGADSVQVNKGLFNVMLGSLTPIPQALFSGNSSLWLGIDVGTDVEMTPRVQLGSAPYAIQASRAFLADRAYALSAPDDTPANAVSVDNDGNVNVMRSINAGYWGKVLINDGSSGSLAGKTYTFDLPSDSGTLYITTHGGGNTQFDRRVYNWAGAYETGQLALISEVGGTGIASVSVSNSGNTHTCTVTLGSSPVQSVLITFVGP